MIPENICSLFATRHDLSFQDTWAIQVFTELNAKQLLLPVIDFIFFLLLSNGIEMYDFGEVSIWKDAKTRARKFKNWL